MAVEPPTTGGRYDYPAAGRRLCSTYMDAAACTASTPPLTLPLIPIWTAAFVAFTRFNTVRGGRDMFSPARSGVGVVTDEHRYARGWDARYSTSLYCAR